MRSACFKATCDQNKSRSAVLLYRGRVVGCIFSDSQSTESLPSEYSLQKMFEHCGTGANITIYPLLEEIISPMASLFQGQPIQRSDNLDAYSYTHYILEWLRQTEHTACLSLLIAFSRSMILGFIYEGKFVGSFHVETQEFSKDINSIYKFIINQPDCRVEASILPPEFSKGTNLHGVSLSQNMPRNEKWWT